MQASIRDKNPVVFLENELMYGENFQMDEKCLDYDWQLELGKAKVEVQGTDITIVAHSRAVGFSVAAAKELKEAGINAEVCHRPTVRFECKCGETSVDSIRPTARREETTYTQRSQKPYINGDALQAATKHPNTRQRFLQPPNTQHHW